ncbi:MAG: glycosyltransferase family 4 protein [candidate division NC10 bacterium]|nr:glycosyltransferase family 4 protein [candidate division NC10 bacterium]
MIRVLHLITRLDVGGSTENTVISASRMPKGEFSCSILSGRTTDPPPGMLATLAAADVEWVQLPQLRREVNPVLDVAALFGLRRLIKRIRPDIVHTHSSKAGFLGRLAARLAGVRHIVYTPHGHIFDGYFSPAATKTFIGLEQVAARWTDRFVTLSDDEARDHLRHGIGQPEQFVTIPSGVDLGPVIGAQPLHIATGRPVVGTVARLAPVKGIAYLVRAAPRVLASVPDARFLIVGDGEQRMALEREARDLGLADRIHFTGFREDVPALIAGMDFFVLPSLNEGMGRVLVMAMARGKPIVATRVGGVPELLGEGEAGLLVPPADPAALAGAICSLLQDPVRLRAIAEAGRRRAPQYSADKMVKSLAELYRDVMGKVD